MFLKFSLFVSILFASLFAMAVPRQYHIDSKIFYQGKNISSPRIITMEGKSAKVMQVNQKRQSEYSVEIVPTKTFNNDIQIKYNVVFREEEGETISRGEVLVPENKNGRISIDHGRIQLYLKVKES